ncbi:MAG: repressor LexA [Magnetococcales bacterium]|nr:repressor LexA [Magnetococcales bacterium]
MTDIPKKRKGPQAMVGPTPVQNRILALIKDFVSARGMSPTITELSELMGVKPPSMHEQVAAMLRKGLVRRIEGKVRTLEVVEDSPHAPQVPYLPGLTAVPILGLVTAGAPILAAENRIGEVWVESSVVRGSCFALQVKGDSMVDANIHDGDFVIVRRQPIAENGEIVVALLGDEATVKRLFISNTSIELRPANASYRPIRIGQEDELKILGKVLAVRSTALGGDS